MMVSRTRQNYSACSNRVFVPSHEGDKGLQGTRHLAAARIVEEESRHLGCPIFQQRDQLAFRYCRSDLHLGEIADTDTVDYGLKYEIGVVGDKRTADHH